MKAKPQRTSVAVQWLRLDAPNAGGLDLIWIRSLVGVQGSHMPWGVAKKKKRERERCYRKQSHRNAQ